MSRVQGLGFRVSGYMSQGLALQRYLVLRRRGTVV